MKHLPPIPGNVSEDAINLLNECGAMQSPHSGRTLFDHLLGTYTLLQSWGNADAVCLGGLFHSIYGTNVFKRKSLLPTQRQLLQTLIGTEAEQLAWHFCHIDRPHAILAGLRQHYTAHASANPSPTARNVMGIDGLQLFHWQALAEIECANLIEQGHWRNSLRDLYCLGLEYSGSLSHAALSTLRQGLANQLRQRQAAFTTERTSP